MNKRIKELILEANIYVAKNAERGSTKEILDDLKDGKFAELIIQECAAVCMDLEKWLASSPKHCAQDIRIHFGFDDGGVSLSKQVGWDQK